MLTPSVTGETIKVLDKRKNITVIFDTYLPL